MKEFLRGQLCCCGYSSADEDYRKFIGEEIYEDICPDYIYFSLDKKDKIVSVKIILDMIMFDEVSVIIIDFTDIKSKCVSDIISDITEYMEDVGYYEEMDSYPNRLCFGRRIE